MTCKDCVHYEVCYCGGYCIWSNIEQTEEDHCPYIKNKADFVEVKHGEWFVDDFPKQGKKFIICSECRSVIDCNVTYIDENEYDYCPYCGADMKKEGADNG